MENGDYQKGLRTRKDRKHVKSVNTEEIAVMSSSRGCKLMHFSSTCFPSNTADMLSRMMVFARQRCCSVSARLKPSGRLACIAVMKMARSASLMHAKNCTPGKLLWHSKSKHNSSCTQCCVEHMLSSKHGRHSEQVGTVSKAEVLQRLCQVEALGRNCLHRPDKGGAES